MAEKDMIEAVEHLAKAVGGLCDALGNDACPEVQNELREVYRCIGCDSKRIAEIFNEPYYITSKGHVRETEGGLIIGRVVFDRPSEKHCAMVRIDGEYRCVAWGSAEACARTVYNIYKGVQ